MPPLSVAPWDGSESQDRDEKIVQIRRACDIRDLDAVRKLAVTKGGLVNDSLRRTACECQE